MNATRSHPARPTILAVDGGNSKTDVALVGRDGRLLAALRGPSSSHQVVGLETGMAILDRLVRRALREAGLREDSRPVAERALLCMAGADFATDLRLLRRGVGRLGLADAVDIRNDAFAGLRAGASRPWGVVVVMGHGVNVGGVAPDGRSLVHAPGDHTSGDWGGGSEVGERALSAAVRARDGRGPRTSLERLVPAFFGLTRPLALTRAIYEKRIPERRLDQVAPVVFRAAVEGDAVARGIVDWVADEAIGLARSAIRTLGLSRTDVEVVLSGGLFRNDDPIFHERVRAGILAAAPGARVIPLTAPPVLGAALLGLDLEGAGPRAEARLRAELRSESIVIVNGGQETAR